MMSELDRTGRITVTRIGDRIEIQFFQTPHGSDSIIRQIPPQEHSSELGFHLLTLSLKESQHVATELLQKLKDQ